MKVANELRYPISKPRKMREELDRLLDYMQFDEYIQPKYLGDDPTSKKLYEFFYNMFAIIKEQNMFGVNGVFFVHPYTDDDDDIPNFYFVDKDLAISWHMMPFRNATSNIPITVEQFAKIIDECIEAVLMVKQQYIER